MHKTITIVTHSGSFHADDVFAVASLLLLLERKEVEVRVLRSRDSEVIKRADFVVDVGGFYDAASNRFDHHQPGGAGVRENRVPYAAFGLVWKHFGREIAGSDNVAAFIDARLAQSIDYGDNFGSPLAEYVAGAGVYPYTIDRIVNVFGNTYEEKGRNTDEAFFRLVSFAKEVLSREIVRGKVRENAQPLVERAYREASDKRLVVLDDEYSWLPILIKYPEPLYVVFPDGGSGNWGVSAVRRGEYEFENRKDMPKAWAGKRDAELAEVSGVPDAVFCHNRLFFAVAKSREGALALAQKAVNAA